MGPNARLPCSLNEDCQPTLTDSPPQPRFSCGTWSDQLADRYALRFSGDLAAWFDEELWRTEGGGEFSTGLDPRALLGPAPDAVWPALMPPDLLPIVGNGAGDWLCLWVGPGGETRRVVFWYHGGGDWIPWGKTLAEAVLFGAVFERLPGPHRRHATPPEPSRTSPHPDSPVVRWAAGHLPAEVAEAWIGGLGDDELATVMLRHGVAEEAVRCELIQNSLREPLSAKLDPVAGQGIYPEWDRVVEWMFDLRRMPASIRNDWADLFEIDLDDRQDWAAVERHASWVAERTPELAWAWDLLGYCHHRRGCLTDAINAYRQGVRASAFTDQSIRLRTHWIGERCPKFSLAMLRDLDPDGVEQSPYLRSLDIADPARRRTLVTDYWRNQTRECLDRGDGDAAYAAAYAAGWDIGATPLADYAELLDDLRAAAALRGSDALLALAETHRACLRSRYNL